MRLPFPGRVVAGVMLGLLGGACALAGVIEFRRAGTTVNPLVPDKATSLVSSGIYRFTRNPMYLGFLLALAGVVLAVANVAAAALVPLFVVVLNRVQIGPEERAMNERFGEEYRRYQASVRRWI